MFKPLQTRALAVSGAALPIWGGAAVLTPLRLSGTETLGHLYDYTVEMATVDSSTLGIWQAKDLVKPEALIGQEIEISIEFEGNGEYIPGMPGDTGVGNFGAGTVQYHEDDPDKPYISDRMVNQFNRPPWKLPDNLALSGTRTCDLKGN
ncbi:MAG TPA: hypothetical protein VF573_17525, partial [Paraburkholderia sp.]